MVFLLAYGVNKDLYLKYKYLLGGNKRQFLSSENWYYSPFYIILMKNVAKY